MDISKDPPFKRRLLIVFIITSLLYTEYYVTNHFPIFEPILLPQTFIDEQIPFLLWTVYPYLLLLSGAYLALLLRRGGHFWSCMIALMVGLQFNYLTFLLYPTYIIRPDVAHVDGFGIHCYRWLLSVDESCNCFPSGHITTPSVVCWYLLRENRAYWTIVLFCLFLFITVLTTKQHYVIDIAGGLATAAMGIIIYERWIRGRLLEKQEFEIDASK